MSTNIERLKDNIKTLQKLIVAIVNAKNPFQPAE